MTRTDPIPVFQFHSLVHPVRLQVTKSQVHWKGWGERAWSSRGRRMTLAVLGLSYSDSPASLSFSGVPCVDTGFPLAKVSAPFTLAFLSPRARVQEINTTG